MEKRALAWVVPAMAGLVLVSGCNTSRKTTAPVLQSTPVSTQGPVPGSWMQTEEIVGVKRVDWVPAETLPVPAVARTTPYVIAKGDTLSKIALQYDLRWQDIAAVNPGLDANKLRLNQTIQLPGVVDVAKKREVQSRPVVTAPVKTEKAVEAGDNVYIVKRGDTLSEIAHKHGVKTAELKAVNGLTSDMIREKQKLTLPAHAKKDGATVKPPAAPQPLQKKVEEKKVIDKPAEPAKVAPQLPTPPVAPPVVPPVAPVIDKEVTTIETTVSEYRTHTVQPGEDVFSVAIRWGVTPVEVRELNKIEGNVLKPGTELKIPPPPMPAL